MDDLDIVIGVLMAIVVGIVLFMAAVALDIGGIRTTKSKKEVACEQAGGKYLYTRDTGYFCMDSKVFIEVK